MVWETRKLVVYLFLYVIHILIQTAWTWTHIRTFLFYSISLMFHLVRVNVAYSCVVIMTLLWLTKNEIRKKIVSLVFF